MGRINIVDTAYRHLKITNLSVVEELCAIEEVDVYMECKGALIEFDFFSLQFKIKKMSTTIIGRFDALWKGLIEELFREFIEFFLEEGSSEYDFSTVEFLDKELELLDKKKETKRFKRFADKIISVKLKADPGKRDIIHIEVDGSDESGFAKRMFTYGSLIYSKFDTNRIKAIVVFTGNRKNQKNFFSFKYWRTEMNYKFHTYNICEQPIAALKASTNPFALIVLTTLLKLNFKKMSEDDLHSQFEWIYLKLDEYIPSYQKLTTLQLYINDCLEICLGKSENFNNFVNRLETIIKNKNIMGIEELLKNEAREEEREVAKIEREKLTYEYVKATLKKSGLSIRKIAEMFKLSEYYVVWPPLNRTIFTKLII